MPMANMTPSNSDDDDASRRHPSDIWHNTYNSLIQQLTHTHTHTQSYKHDADLDLQTQSQAKAQTQTQTQTQTQSRDSHGRKTAAAYTGPPAGAASYASTCTRLRSLAEAELVFCKPLSPTARDAHLLLGPTYWTQIVR